MRERAEEFSFLQEQDDCPGVVCSAYSLDLRGRTSIWRLFCPQHLPHS
jgi:hypothetical protein